MSASLGILVPFVLGLMPPSDRVLLALEPVGVEALHGCEAVELEDALRSGLAKANRFRLAHAGEAVRLEILDCTLLAARKRTLTSTARPVRMPTDGGLAAGSEGEVALQTESLRHASLRGRIVAGSRSVNVASGPKDRTLREAVDSLRKAIDERLRNDREWLLARP